MNPLYIVLIAGILVSIVAGVNNSRTKKRDESPEAAESDAERREYYLKKMRPDETLLSVTPNQYPKHCYWALSNQRLFIEDQDGEQELSLTQVNKMKTMRADGSKTSADNAYYLEVKTDIGKFKLYKASSSFADFAYQLSNQVDK